MKTSEYNTKLKQLKILRPTFARKHTSRHVT